MANAMSSAAERLNFYPPRPYGTGQALSLALLAHAALLGALAWGVSWKKEATFNTMQAELWSSLPEQAAPKLQEVLQAPTPLAPPEPPAAKAPEIAVEKEAPKRPLKPEVRPPPVLEAKPNKAAEEKKLAEQKEADRQRNLERMAGLAGGSGAPLASGTAAQSSGPSNGYAGVIKGRVRPSLVFTGNVSGNPLVSVEVRLGPDGTVLGRPRVLKSSGNKEWDEAVVRAFEKTEVLPRDGNKIWSPLIIDWRVND